MKKSIIYLAVLPLLVACNHGGGEVQQPLTPFEKGQLVYITSQSLNKDQSSNPSYVHAREEVDTTLQNKITAEKDYITRLLWDEGDQIDVFVDDNKASHPQTGEYPQSVFNLVSGANTQEGTFRGEMPAAGTTYAFMYPHRDTTDAATKTIIQDFTESNPYPYQVTQFTMPQVQRYRNPEIGPTRDKKGTQLWPSFDTKLLPICGKGNLKDSFALQVCGGALRFKLWSDSTEIVKSIVLSAKGDKVLWGSFIITPNSSGKMEMAAKVVGNHDVIFQLPDSLSQMPKSQENAVWIYFVLPAPLTFTSGFYIYTYNEDKTQNTSAKPTHVYETSNGSIQIVQGYVTTINFKNTGNQGNIHGADWNKPAPEQ